MKGHLGVMNAGAPDLDISTFNNYELLLLKEDEFIKKCEELENVSLFGMKSLVCVDNENRKKFIIHFDDFNQAIRALSKADIKIKEKEALGWERNKLSLQEKRI